ncbi:serine hydrolase [Streptomyces sp. H27-D2]|uniref:serine hydrolase n=1 Tax=Streptomyces sp. H27-D2 TaxID=3046304 RepID=UPI002DBB8DC5|nr:serine hydrolase [Streptomyces sp. H27-D2]MEC4015488.1 serine hydrolase [Streptomyces sp. H27-D2]
MTRRQFGTGALALGGALLLASTPAGTALATPPAPTVGSPPAGTVLSAGRARTTLRRGSAQRAGLLEAHLRRLVTDAEAFMGPSPTHPYYPGAVLLGGRGGTVALEESIGQAVRYARYDEATDTGVEFPADQQRAMAADTVFDLASVSKLFTSILAVQQIERGALALEATAASYLPEFGAAGKQAITIRQLLTHTSGFRPDLKFFDRPSWEEKLQLLWNEAPLNPPGTRYLYSDLNLITLQLVLERITGRKLDALLRENVTGPLGMTSTRYNPPASWKPRIAATEDQRKPWARLNRGLVWGEVHDENAWSFGGVAGHAGVFSCAWDLAVLCRTLLNGGAYGSARILRPESVRQMFTDFNTAFPGDEHGLGFELYQHWYMGAMASPKTAGHTGFTGTSIVLDPTTDSFLVLLSNAVHPCRNWRAGSAPRVAAANNMARAVPVRPAHGRTAWFAGMANAATATLMLPALTFTASRPELRCDLWWDTEPTSDAVYLEASRDGGDWQPVPFTTVRTARPGSTDADADAAGAESVPPDASGSPAASDAPCAEPVPHPAGSATGYSGRVWQRVRADLAAWRGGGPVRLRWRYATDPLYVGRGVYADAIRVEDGRRTLFDDARPADAGRISLQGWTSAAD